MRDAITGCPERALTPPERADRVEIDEDMLYQRMEDEKYELEFVRADK